MYGLLKGLIAIPSFSREETAAADFMEAYMCSDGLPVRRIGNNLYCLSDEDPGKPLLLLNAHIDTVRPAASYTRDPFAPTEENGRIYGLGSNDDGGSLLSLLEAYKRLSAKPQPYRLCYSATAEEEVCGKGGIESLFPYLGHIALAVMGEPTGMDMAVAERGLMVLDCESKGKSGHAARNEGVNAIYEALPDIEWFRSHSFERVSEFLGPVKMTVTQINAGTQHNVVPDSCKFVVDLRSNGLYTNPELLELVRDSVRCEVRERSTRLGASHISIDHPIVRRGLEMGLAAFGSPTTSNQTVTPYTSIKIGPGQSSRSHSADEYIEIREIEDAIDKYCRLLDGLDIL